MPETTIEEFADKYDAGDTDGIFHRWKADDLLHGSIGPGVVLADLIHEDGLNDQVSEELRDAFRNLTSGEVHSYQEARERIAEALREGGSGVSQQWISTIKGRVGENQFLEAASEEVEGKVQLAELSDQKGYDIVYQPPGGDTRYIDVKTSGDPDYITSEMAETQAELEAGEITTPDGEVVADIEFAVPSNVFEEVQGQAAEQGLDLNLIPIDSPSWHATEIVEAGVDAVGPEAFEHLFEEIFVGTLTASALHSMREGFQVYKGAKNTQQAFEDAAEETALSGGSLGAGFVVESALREAALVGEPTTMAITFGSSIAVRTVLGDFAKRADHAELVTHQNARLRKNLETLQSL